MDDALARSGSVAVVLDRKRRRSLLPLLNEITEREIRRIAHSVHDEAGQLLDAARLAIAAVARDVDPSVRERLRQVGSMLDRAESELRRIAHELRPLILDDLGVVAALQVLGDGISRRAGVQVRVESFLKRRPPPAVETALYRVVQEALTNVVRHSGAKNAAVQLDSDGEGNVRCAVTDDGVGFDVAATMSDARARGLGLLGIRERVDAMGGSLCITSRPARGTVLSVVLPAEA